MTGVAWSYEEPSAAAKVVKDFRKDNEKLKIKAGLSRVRCSTAKAVENQLATMPGKNELARQLLATMQAPLQQLRRAAQRARAELRLRPARRQGAQRRSG